MTRLARPPYGRPTVDAVAELVPALPSRGYARLTVSELLGGHVLAG